MNFFSEVIHSLNDHDVRFLVFGGFAVNYYGVNRYTADLDIWVDPEPNNLRQLEQSIYSLGYDASENLANFLNKKALLLRLVDNNHKVDLLQKITLNKAFDECFSAASFSDTPFGKIHFISYTDLIEEKLLTHRPKDLLDIKELKLLNE